MTRKKSPNEAEYHDTPEHREIIRKLQETPFVFLGYRHYSTTLPKPDVPVVPTFNLNRKRKRRKSK
jgi:hypothetical protein